jgi:hypothetical protein
MKMKEVFAMIVRIIGLLGLVYVFVHIIQNFGHVEKAPVFYCLRKLVYVICGFYMVAGAPLLLRLAYQEKAEPPTATPKQ